MTAFRTLDQADVKDKRVLVRLDLNVPTENGKVTDVTRIERAAPTITELADKGAKVILLSHFGRPKEGPEPKFSLEPVAKAVSEVIGRPVAFASDCVGEVAEAAVAKLAPGDILCLENTRFYKDEEKNTPAFVDKLAALGDVWVNDAFSAAHRAHASTEGLGHKLPAYAGRSMQAELEALGKALEQPKRPVAAVVGGAKISGKLDLLGNLLDKVDVLIIGGGMANTFLAAAGKPVGKSLCETDLIPTAQEIVDKANRAGKQILLPVDAVVAEKFEANAPSKVVGVDEVGPTEMILDVGPRSIEHVVSELERLKTLLWNGPFGAFEIAPFDTGTVEIAEAAAELSAAGKLVTVAGGGDTVAALNHAGAADRFTYISTAGGAFLEWLEGKALPGVEILKVK
ncbi:Phosphoglycerate kinase [Rhodovulum sp. PH10]|uniref:phosphoglycerate kinase n=1 Tax=Rhodovulum sp. PH10 TaxID=1187851 RepID=UPI00027C1DE0|nr:phosphoglycerate kinase [Rhodovulum sp. PH10]EJW12923.1 Phosphoglycerate kinase [Rhodovulum sp. PH10]